MNTRPVLLETPSEPPLDDPAPEPRRRSYQRNRPSQRRRYPSRSSPQDDDRYQQDDDRYHQEDYNSKKHRSKSSIIKKYKKGSKYNDYRWGFGSNEVQHAFILTAVCKKFNWFIFEHLSWFTKFTAIFVTLHNYIFLAFLSVLNTVKQIDFVGNLIL